MSGKAYQASCGITVVRDTGSTKRLLVDGQPVPLRRISLQAVGETKDRQLPAGERAGRRDQPAFISESQRVPEGTHAARRKRPVTFQ
jgi:hypothetical protein